MSELKFKGKITSILEKETGVSGSGDNWSKLSFLVEDTSGQYPRTAGFIIFGDEKIDKFLQYNKVNAEVEVSFDIRSREYNGKVYTDLNAWKVWGVNRNQTDGNSAPPPTDEEEDDLPF